MSNNNENTALLSNAPKTATPAVKEAFEVVIISGDPTGKVTQRSIYVTPHGRFEVIPPL